MPVDSALLNRWRTGSFLGHAFTDEALEDEVDTAALEDQEQRRKRDLGWMKPWEAIVTDEQGRRRFHGAFTGGFSAGYFNTVGSKEGWAPSAFSSSRRNRATVEQRVEDLMDEEDKQTFFAAGRSIQPHAHLHRIGTEKRGLPESGGAGDALPGALAALLDVPSGESIGSQLLCKLSGLRHARDEVFLRRRARAAPPSLARALKKMRDAVDMTAAKDSTAEGSLPGDKQLADTIGVEADKSPVKRKADAPVAAPGKKRIIGPVRPSAEAMEESTFAAAAERERDFLDYLALHFLPKKDFRGLGSTDRGLRGVVSSVVDKESGARDKTSSQPRKHGAFGFGALEEGDEYATFGLDAPRDDYHREINDVEVNETKQLEGDPAPRAITDRPTPAIEAPQERKLVCLFDGRQPISGFSYARDSRGASTPSAPEENRKKQHGFFYVKHHVALPDEQKEKQEVALAMGRSIPLNRASRQTVLREKPRPLGLQGQKLTAPPTGPDAPKQDEKPQRPAEGRPQHAKPVEEAPQMALPIHASAPSTSTGRALWTGVSTDTRQLVLESLFSFRKFDSVGPFEANPPRPASQESSSAAAQREEYLREAEICPPPHRYECSWQPLPLVCRRWGLPDPYRKKPFIDDSAMMHRQMAASDDAHLKFASSRLRTAPSTGAFDKALAQVVVRASGESSDASSAPKVETPKKPPPTPVVVKEEVEVPRLSTSVLAAIIGDDDD